jgi:hypothetical protein
MIHPFKGKTATEILAKTAGIGAIGLIGYDAHSTGNMLAKKNTEEAKSMTLHKRYFDDMTVDSSSVVKSKIKKRIFDFHLDENFFGFFDGVAGYAKGFGTMLVNNVIPLGLSAGALITKGGWSKAFGLGLGIYGGIFLLQEVFGIGKLHH